MLGNTSTFYISYVHLFMHRNGIHFNKKAVL